MILDVNQPLIDADDKPVKAQDGREMRLRDALVQVLIADGCPNDEKLQRYALYRAVKEADRHVPLNLSEVKILKQLTLAFPVVLAGQINRMLEELLEEGGYNHCQQQLALEAWEKQSPEQVAHQAALNRPRYNPDNYRSVEDVL